MLRHVNNAVMITSIQGEGGLPGFPGLQGEACFTGIGDPNDQSFTHPDYSGDPSTFTRGTETFYYQDTFTGEVWKTSSDGRDFVAPTFGGDTWEKTSIVLKGDRGTTGPNDYSKIEVCLSTTVSGFKEFIVDGSNLPVDKEVCKVLIAGTGFGTYDTVRVIMRQNNDNAPISTTVYLKNSAGTTLASGTYNSNDNVDIVDLALSGESFPQYRDYVTLSFDSTIAAGQYATVHFMYLLVT